MHRTRTTGFTLIELMVTIAIVGILAAIAFPSFEGSLRSNRVATMTNELLGSLSLARSEAIRSSDPAIICASANGTTCGTDWNKGWIIWVDEDGSGDISGREAVVRYVQAHANMSLAVNTTGGAIGGVFTFDSRGRPDNDGGQRMMVLKPANCPSGQKLQREMTITNVGQINTQAKTCT